MREQIDFKRFPWTRTGNHIYKILLIYKKRINIHIAASDGLVSKCGAKPWKVSTIDETVIKDWKIGYCQNGSILVFLAMIFTGSIWLFFAFIGLAFFSSWVFKIKKPGKTL